MGYQQDPDGNTIWVPLPGEPASPPVPTGGGGTTTGGGGFALPSINLTPQQIVDASGRVFVYDPGTKQTTPLLGPDGQQVVTRAPGTSSSSSNNVSSSTSNSTSQSFQDPQALAIQAAQQQAEAAYQQGQIAQQQATLNETIRKNTQDLALQNANLEYLKNNAAFQQAQGTASDARAAQQQLFTQQQAVAGLQLQQATLQQQAASLQANLQSQTQQFNATQGLATQKANQDYAVQRQGQLQALASQAGTLAADPGDRGKYAAFALANSGWGQQDQALAGGANLFSSDSLAPLESTLQQRQQVMNEPASPYSFTPLQTPQVPQFNLGSLTLPTPQQPPTIGSTAQPQATTAGGTPTATPAANSGSSGPNGSAGGSLGVVNGQAVWNPSSVPAAKTGGFMNSAYISGEAGPELNIPLGDGRTLILNQQEAQGMGMDLKAMAKQGTAARPGIVKFADGGIFSGTPLDSSQSDPNQQLAKDFLGQSLTNARAGTPFTQGALPTPVFASSPGFNPYVAQLLASLQAQSSGYPAQAFLSQAQLYTPRGVNEAPIGRAA